MKVSMWFAKVCLAGCIAIALLSLFTLSYFYTGVHRPNPSGATDFLWEPYQWIIDRKEGNACFRLDANGLNNPVGAADEPVDILLMGDSHMEAAHISASENVSALLNKLYPEKHTYNIALGGHTLYTCVKNIENALDEFEPTDYVLLDVKSVETEADSMRKVINDQYETAPSYNQTILAALQVYVPAIKLMYKQLEDWVTVEAAQKTEQIQQAAPKDQETLSLLDSFLKKAADAASKHGVQPLIFYIPPTNISPGGGIDCQTDRNMLSDFSQACEHNGIVFVDMTHAFERLYTEQHVLPYGFINTRVGKGHLNRYGCRAVADELVRVLTDLDRQGE